ncbi:TPA: hypothetical protein HA238_05230 [Candidatus Micrarchaeota archaeon]|nr:hypothetical protein [Candidatus Micrarchaeota archaeon]
MRAFLVVFMLLALLSISVAEFKLTTAEMTVNSIQKDGSAKVTERIKFVVIGGYEQSKYKDGVNNNDLGWWVSTTGIGEIRKHVTETAVDVSNFRLRPQPLKKCDPFLNLCHGELVLEYDARPYYDKNTSDHIEGTGLFTTTNYKPRTTRYSLNSNVLLFRNVNTVQPMQPNTSSSPPSTTENIIIIDKNVYFTIQFPQNTILLDASQLPESSDISLPDKVASLSWTNTILSHFTLVFDVEESLDKEVVEFFSSTPLIIQEIFFGKYGPAVLIIVIVLLGSYLLLNVSAKKRSQ